MNPAVVVLLLAPLLGFAAAAEAADTAASLRTAVRAQQLLVLDLTDEAQAKGFDARSWETYAAKEDALGAVADAVQKELETRQRTGTGSLTELTALLDALETPARFSEGDLLTFDDLVRDVRDSMVEARLTGDDAAALRARLESLVARIARIRTELDAEAAAASSAPDGAKGGDSRPRWERYLATLAPVSPSAAPTTEPEELGEAKGGGSRAKTGAELPRRTFVLTFDDGPHASRTDRILGILRAARTPACFFQVGNRIGTVSADGAVTLGRGADASRRVLAAGYALGNHSFTHRDLKRLGVNDRRTEILHTDLLLQKVGAHPVRLFRPPYGSFDASLATFLIEHTQENVLWNVDSLDWKDPLPSAITARVLKEARDVHHGIILFHDIHDRTVEALPGVLAGLTAEGFTFAPCSAITP